MIPLLVHFYIEVCMVAFLSNYNDIENQKSEKPN